MKGEAQPMMTDPYWPSKSIISWLNPGVKFKLGPDKINKFMAACSGMALLWQGHTTKGNHFAYIINYIQHTDISILHNNKLNTQITNNLTSTVYNHITKKIISFHMH